MALSSSSYLGLSLMLEGFVLDSAIKVFMVFCLKSDNPQLKLPGKSWWAPFPGVHSYDATCLEETAQLSHITDGPEPLESHSEGAAHICCCCL